MVAGVGRLLVSARVVTLILVRFLGSAVSLHSNLAFRDENLTRVKVSQWEN